MRELKSAALIAFTVGCALAPAAHADSSSTFDQYVGKTCTGVFPTLQSSYQRPYLTNAPIVAKFFRSSSGRPWVSFKVDGRYPVDLSVSLRSISLRDDVLEFGSRYTLGYAGTNHLSGHYMALFGADHGATYANIVLTCR
jgi:hypothetical protein